ncbi:MAG TPA: HAMP domain-containing sensor histidine kinase, partial [Gemmataceae bacterium]
MRWPIRNQIFVPFATVLLAAVTTLALGAARLAADRSERETTARLARVVGTLGSASFPYTENVLRQMRGLSGAEFAAFDEQGRVTASTLPAAAAGPELLAAVPASRTVRSLAEYPSVPVAGESYLAARLPVAAPGGAGSLVVLYPERSLAEARWTAAWPPLAVGGATLLVMLAVSAWLAQRLGRRIGSIRELFAGIADGRFGSAPVRPPLDELAELTCSANRLSGQLEQMRRTIAHTERVRLLAQLAGGLAHQLRNAVAGARLAVQLHQRRCPAAADESLAVALRQLELTEEQVKALLALGRREAAGEQVPGALASLIAEVEALIGPACRHAQVRLETDVRPEAGAAVVADAPAFRTALLNLALNAVEAAGVGGAVGLRAVPAGEDVVVEVADTGSGPPPEIAESLFEPFVTSKPEGLGLGLALARQTAADLGGSLSWRRSGGRTVFALRLPRPPAHGANEGADPQPAAVAPRATR